ncbi:HIT-like protein [Metschnikowia bicuspidata var. bicuspidata NRRL YB-4993]|uniref:Bis(5'-adenosyl)-triphosphatase n=1 Tax=Metschnikowia bicuspidata var. bicuspidata NRRL YB-4993 TaxID=869754 RepID=A0A1A0HCK3_9ASCO|nr:HIT-like protein [Metschnikowia bicuspidata var. bicuspidata NRRL YB-4993]OBA21653.1 HIT-like protein [Metschnikowia bicuspidata var. bicuspidata NRRL YB-4993]
MHEPVLFYKFAVDLQVFFRSAHTYALVNLKPLVPGHVLVVPLRTSVLRFGDLTPAESQDYMATLQVVQRLISRVHRADSLNLAIQDGPESGQSVPHLHTHIIPRFKNDTHDDSIHRQLENTDLAAAYAGFFARKKTFRDSPGFVSIPDADRHPRCEEDMAKEAAWLRAELAKADGAASL